jgi:AcrR family transcriptional regulator
MRRLTPAKKHHHGNLRPALIKAGLELLEEGGIDALTLRKCAARAGVSHAAPAHHFDGLPGLKQAIATEAFQIFSNHLQEAIDRGEQTARGRIYAICRGYLQFGLSHRGLLNVIFGFDGLAAIANPDGKDTAHAYQILRDVCAPFVPDGTDERIVEAQVWSLIHGFTLLYIAGEFGSPPPPIDIGPFDQVMALLDRIGSPPTS